jgi:hypothetical protein
MVQREIQVLMAKRVSLGLQVNRVFLEDRVQQVRMALLERKA